MPPLRDWSLARVLLLSVGWILLCVLTTAAWVFVRFRQVFDASTGSGGIGAVSFGINALVLAIPLAPPAILILAWLIAQRLL